MRAGIAARALLFYKRGVGLRTYLALALACAQLPPARAETADTLLPVPGGRFLMGDPDAQDSVPVHAVDTDPFQMDRCETTAEQMRQVLQWAWDHRQVTVTAAGVVNTEGDRRLLLDLGNASRPLAFSNGVFRVAPERAELPCAWVTWYGAMAYCAFRTAMEPGLAPCVSLRDWSCDFAATGYRLPTEAEWEKAARGPLVGNLYPWPSPRGGDADPIDPAKANYIASTETAGNGPRPVGRHQRGFGPLAGFVSYGLCDMAGNVAEWCWDWYDARTYSCYATNGWPRNPAGPAASPWEGRALRGGSWFSIAEHLRCAHRSHLAPDTATLFAGFRTVRRAASAVQGPMEDGRIIDSRTMAAAPYTLVARLRNDPAINGSATSGPLSGTPDLVTAIEQDWMEADFPEMRRGHAPDFCTGAASALLAAERTLRMVARQCADTRGTPPPDFQRRLDDLRGARAGANWTNLYFDAHRLRRDILLSSPRLDFDSLLLFKGGPPRFTSNIVDQYLGRWSRPGEGLVRLDYWRDRPAAVPLLKGRLPPGAVQNLDLSFDASRVVFSFCNHTETNAAARAFRLWEAAADGAWARPLTGVPGRDPLRGEDGCTNALIEDFDPCWLPDGGVAFLSTRCESFSRCQAGRYAPSYVLYRVEPDGRNVRRLSFMESNEWTPCVLNDGRLLFTQWDYVNRHEVLFQGLWSCLPDGTSLSHVYGNYTANPCAVAQARPIPGSGRIVAVASAHHSITCGPLVTIDPRRGQDGEAPLTRLTPDICFPETEGWPAGNYMFPHPLDADLFLVSYSPDTVPFHWELARTNAYGIYLFDTAGGRELIYRDPAASCFKPVPLTSRERPPLANGIAPPAGSAVSNGMLIVRNVYDGVPSLAPGSVKSLRVVRLYEQRPQRARAGSANQIEFLKGVVGTAPVRADGSAAFRAPAGVPLLFQLLDADGMSVMSMRSQFFLQPGETRCCLGCHESRRTAGTTTARPWHGRIDDLAPPAGLGGEGGLSFARTVQPVLDRYCIRCHGLNGKKEGGMMLLGTPAGPFSAAYLNLVSREGLAGMAWRREESYVSRPGEYGAHASGLVRILREGHKARLTLDADSFARIVEWLDLNGQYAGEYRPATEPEDASATAPCE